MKQLRTRFPEEAEVNLLAMLRVLGGIGAITDVLRGRREPTRKETVRMEMEVRRAQAAIERHSASHTVVELSALRVNTGKRAQRGFQL